MCRVLPFLAFASILLCSCSTERKASIPSPNVLFILADDLGYSDLSCMGSRYYETPNIDRIAKNGMIFGNGYAACQVCSPSRASIMTGQFPSRHGITDWIGAGIDTNWRRAKRYTRLLPPAYQPHLDHDLEVLPEVFKRHGYQTFFAGKWHLGNKGSYPQDHGFDINQGGYERGGPYSGGFFSPFDNPQMDDHPDEVGMSLPEKLAKETINFLRASKDQKFLAYLSFYAVHAPIQTTEENWRKYRDKAVASGVDESGFEMELRLPIRRHQDNPVYAGLIEHMDDAVGQVLDALEDLGLSENTIVVFTSDNGGVASGDNFSTNLSPLRGGKGYQWEGGIKVPYLVSVPWLDLAGQVSEVRVSGVDFFPSLLDLADLPSESQTHLDGLSFVPALLGDPMPDRDLIWHYPHYGNQGGDPSSVLVRGDWKLIRYHEDNSYELYDLSNDISESTDLAAEHTDLVIELGDALSVHLRETSARFGRPDPLYNQDSFDLKYQYFKEELMPRLEERRTQMLSDDYQPNADWWGSQVVKD